jgi:hypothetical protein
LVLDYRYTGVGRLDAAANHLPSFAPGLAEFSLFDWSLSFSQ